MNEEGSAASGRGPLVRAWSSSSFLSEANVAARRSRATARQSDPAACTKDAMRGEETGCSGKSATPQRRRRAIAVTIGAAALAGAHIVASGEPGVIGPLLVLDHLFNLALVSALLALCHGVGLMILRALSLRDEPPLDTCVFGVGLGAGAVGTGILLLGLIGLLYPPVLGILMVGVAWLARRELRALPGLWRAAVHQLVRGGRWPRLRTAAVVLSGLVGLFLFALALTPPVDWDSLLLHLRAPTQFLLEHRVYLPEDNLPSGFAALIHMLYVPLLAAGSESGPAILSAALTLMLGLTVVALCQRFFDDGIAYLSLIALWGSSLVFMVAVTPRVDVTLAFYALLSQYALLKVLPTRGGGTEGTGAERRQANLLLAALVTGLVASVKYQGIAYAAALAPLVLVASGADAGARIRALAAFAAVSIMVALPWIAKNLLLYDAPFFPMFTGATLPPWLAALYGSPEFPVAGPTPFSGLVWQLSEPFNLRDFFLAPYRLTIEDEALLYYSTPLLVVLPLAAFYLRRRIIVWLLVPGLVYAGILLAYSTSTNLRYLIPTIVALTIVSAAAATLILRRLFPDERARRLVVGMLLVPLSFAPTGFAIYFWATRSPVLTHLVGATSPREFALARPFESTLPRVAADVHDLLPDDSRLLLLFEPRGHAFGGSALQDSQMNHWPLIALAPFDIGCLEEAGITHVLLNMNTLQYRFDQGVDPAALGWPDFSGFEDRCLRALYSRDGFTLFEVRPRGERPESEGPGSGERPTVTRSVVIDPA